MHENESEDLLVSLRSTYERLRSEMKENWQRDLPLSELLFDRWERAKHLGFGEGTSIYHNSYVYGDVRIGHHTWVGPYTLLDGSGGLAIGDFCSISSGVQIYTHDTVKWALSGGKAEYERASVTIGSCSYIGSQTVIAKGVDIGEHCVIGACSFVNRSVPAFSIAVGAPARVIGRVEINGEQVRLIYEPE
ncbi:MAG TPA: acyltransferase [Pyrinomonadaceae bacterium]|nr:acyltransferase [Pyrinomonadaceae bacterium]